ncbi:MAG: hypothetical protein AAGG69_02665 [Pseudomonadota bacterium]
MSEELVFQFDRRADEYVDGAFGASMRMQGTGGAWWMPSKAAVAIWVFVFLVALGAMQLAQNGGFGENTVLAFVVGAIIGMAGMFFVVTSAQTSLARKMKAVVHEGSEVVTRITADRVSSKDEIADIEATWDDVHLVWVENGVLHMMGDMFVHIVPARALTPDQSIADLHGTVLELRESYRGRSQP